MLCKTSELVAATAAAVVGVAASAAVVAVVAAAGRDQENEKDDPAAAVVAHVKTTHNCASLKKLVVETLSSPAELPFHSTYYAKGGIWLQKHDRRPGNGQRPLFRLEDLILTFPSVFILPHLFSKINNYYKIVTFL